MSLEEKIIELNKKEYPLIKDQRIMDLLMGVIVEKETSLNKLIEKTATTLKTIQKYLEEETAIKKYLTDEEFKVFKTTLEGIINGATEKRMNGRIGHIENSKQVTAAEELKIVRNIIDEILHTRHKIEDIFVNNYYSRDKFKALLSSNYIDDNFGKGMQYIIKSKIEENGLIRERVPRDKKLIEDRLHVYVANPNVHCLEMNDFKKLSLASDYLCSGADVDSIVKKRETNLQSIIATLSSNRLEEILEKKHYENLYYCICIEKVLIGNDLAAKENILKDIENSLLKNNFDFELVCAEFNLPHYLLQRLLLEIIKLPHFSDELKASIKSALDINKEEKVK